MGVVVALSQRQQVKVTPLTTMLLKLILKVFFHKDRKHDMIAVQVTSMVLVILFSYHKCEIRNELGWAWLSVINNAH